MQPRYLDGDELERELDKRFEQEPAVRRRGPRNETEYNDAAREKLAYIGHRELAEGADRVSVNADPEDIDESFYRDDTASQDDAVDLRVFGWRPSDRSEP